MKATLLIFAWVMVGCGGSDFAQCYWCKEEVKKDALVCKHCGKTPSLKNSSGMGASTESEPQQLRYEDVVGVYIQKNNGSTWTFMNDGRLDRHCPSGALAQGSEECLERSRWKVADNEIEYWSPKKFHGGWISVINANGDLKPGDWLKDGKRVGTEIGPILSKTTRHPTPTTGNWVQHKWSDGNFVRPNSRFAKETQNTSSTFASERDGTRVAGVYQSSSSTLTFLKNGTATQRYGTRTRRGKWTVSNGYIEALNTRFTKTPTGDLKAVGEDLGNGKWSLYPKQKQTIWRKR
jgi:hypothetical protein